MGIGREVADAYISVHGDLSPFRKDLNKASGSLADWAEENADTFSEAWGKRMESTMGKQWNSIIDTMYSGKKIDFNRMIENFDLDDIDEASKKINGMLTEMESAGKVSWVQMSKVRQALEDQISVIKEQEALEQNLAQERTKWDRAHQAMMAARKVAMRQEAADAKAFAEAQRKMWDEAIRMNRDHDASVRDRARIHESMMKAIAASERKMLNDAYQMNKDHDARLRDRAKMREQIQRNLLAAERSMLNEAYQMNKDHDAKTRLIAQLREKLDKQIQEARSKRMEEAIRENEAWARSFKGITFAARQMDLENKFKAIGQAMATGDWSKIANGAKNMGELSRRTMETAREMRSLGRVTQEEFDQIQKRVSLVSRNTDAYNIKFAEANKRAKEHKNDWVIIDQLIGNAGKKFAGFTGLNVVGDMFRQGAAFFQDLDRNAVNIGKMSLQMGTAASTIITAVGGLAVMGQDLAALGNIGILAPGFLIGAGISMGVLVTALKDMGVVLEDLGPRFEALQDVISENFWAQAEAPIRNLVDNALPTLQTLLGETATSLGGLTGAFADALNNVPLEHVATMFDRMNSAIDILKGAMEPLVSAFTTLGLVASQYFEPFAGWLVSLSEQFNAFIQGAAEDGRLQEWIDRAIQGFKDVGTIIGAAVGIFNAIGDAAEAAGIGGLSSFANTMATISSVMNSEAFQGVLTQLFAGAAEAAGLVGTAIVNLGPAIATFMPTLTNALVTIGQTVSTVIGYLGTILSNPEFRAGIDAFVNGIQQGVEALAPAIGPMAASFGQVATVLGGVATVVGEIVAVLLTSLAPVLDTITAAFGRITFAAGPEIISIIQTLSGALGPVIDTLLPPIENLIMSVLPMLSGAFAALAPIFPVIAAAVAPIITAFQQLIDQVAPVLIPAIQQIVAAVTPVIEVFGQVVQFILSIVVPILGALLSGVITNLVGVFQGLSDFIMGFVQIVTATFTGFAAVFRNLFEGDIGGAVQALGLMFAGIWNGIVQMVSGAVTAIWNAIQLWIVGKLVAGIRTALTGVSGFFTSIWNSITSFLNGAVRNIQSFITSGFNVIGNVIRTIWNTVLNVIRTVWNSIVNNVSTSLSSVANRISSGLASVRAFFQNAWNTMVQLVTTAWGRISSGVTTGISNVMGFVQSIPGRISSALGNLGTLLLGAGQAIMDGLLSGLKNAWGAVTDFVGGIAGWIADNKGPLPYDRRLLIPAGHAIMEGLGKGLEDKLTDLKATLSTITETMADEVIGAFAHSKMYVAGVDAALGLADGLKANKHAVASALNAVMPTNLSTVSLVGRPASGYSEATASTGRSVTVAEGAVQVITPTKDPAIVAAKVLDDIITKI